jgi:hypothetical protein
LSGGVVGKKRERKVGAARFNRNIIPGKLVASMIGLETSYVNFSFPFLSKRLCDKEVGIVYGDAHERTHVVEAAVA